MSSFISFFFSFPLKEVLTRSSLFFSIYIKDSKTQLQIRPLNASWALITLCFWVWKYISSQNRSCGWTGLWLWTIVPGGLASPACHRLVLPEVTSSTLLWTWIFGAEKSGYLLSPWACLQVNFAVVLSLCSPHFWRQKDWCMNGWRMSKSS